MPHSISDKCIGCTLCQRTCPVAAITGQVRQKHTINPLRCVDCGACGMVCPAGAIADASGACCEKRPRGQIPAPVIDAKRCSACEMCVQLCGKDALALSLPQHKGDLRVFAQLAEPNKCVGCGICARVCPLHAIRMEERDAR